MRKEVGMTDRSSTGDRLEGGFDQAKGNVKQGVGDLTGDNQTKSECSSTRPRARSSKA